MTLQLPPIIGFMFASLTFVVKVRGQIRLLDGGSICFGLSEYGVSEFELVAEELLLSDSVIQVSICFL